ncbi:MAG: hypothetical protein H7A51_13400 [Akkermansiaceae bacterium]|nr:hypothetical protein [Akkermansiaceae bacterium]
MKTSIKTELLKKLSHLLEPYRQLSYAELKSMVDRSDPDVHEGYLDSGEGYQIEIQVYWDDEPDGVIRVYGVGDRSPHRPLFGFIPVYLSSVGESILICPDGSFIEG